MAGAQVKKTAKGPLAIQVSTIEYDLISVLFSVVFSIYSECLDERAHWVAVKTRITQDRAGLSRLGVTSRLGIR